MINYHASTDCGFHFSSEKEDDDPLQILKEGDEKAVSLSSKTCTINVSTSMYLDCGTWLPIDEMSVLNKFSLNQKFMDSHILKASDFTYSAVKRSNLPKFYHHGCLQI